MPDYLEKLRPDQDLQCYFERPSAIASLFDATPNSFKVSGTWRQQFDWCVVEWNRDNVYEHPALRNLPDGDFTGYTLTYDESRENCHLMDSNLFATVDWPNLRIWRRVGGVDSLHKIRLRDYATPIEGAWVNPAAELELQGTITAGDYIGVSFLEEQYNYPLTGSDTLASAVEALKDIINTFSIRLSASRSGNVLRVEYHTAGAGLTYPQVGFNGNRMGIYGFISGAGTESWTPAWAYFSGGQSPSKWRITLPFGTMTDTNGVVVPPTHIRKMRWTYGAQMQLHNYVRSEFLVTVTNWTVTAPNRRYKVAGPGSRRIEDHDASLTYIGTWGKSQGNFSDGSLHHTATANAEVRIPYHCPLPHKLYIGTRYVFDGTQLSVTVDGVPAMSENLAIPGEDTLCRLPIGSFPGGTHTVVARHNGSNGLFFYFDFLEIAIESAELPTFPEVPKITLATDWDTDHSIALPPERTAWLIKKLGYMGRANHYVGALWFYELLRKDHIYASATIEFTGTPAFGESTTVTLGSINYPDTIILQHLHRIGDTAASIAKAFEFHLNSGYNTLTASATSGLLTIHSRAMGAEGNALTITAVTSQSGGAYSVTPSGPRLTGGVDGNWRTDLTSTPRVNRACRDWSRAYYQRLKDYGIEVAAAFSTELQHGDPTPEAGIAQRYYNGSPVLLNTPALQTNFSPTSFHYWKQVHMEMADLMQEVGVVPYLQFGEVQWWYFPAALPGGGTTGMPFYDQYTTERFETEYGHPMGAILSDFTDPAPFPHEVEYLPKLIGEFTDQLIAYIRTAHPNAKFEVLYPTDVNDTPLNRLINYPPAHWTPAQLNSLKTESFTFTFTRNLDKARMTIEFPTRHGFSREQRAFLVGVNDPTTVWLKEVDHALAENINTIVFWALDQYCLVGYATPLPVGMRRTAVQG